jgi:hypothetical protein
MAGPSRGLANKDKVAVKGRASVFSLRQSALLGLLAAAEAVLEATGSAVALCPNLGARQR